jgi:hypothetical protein
MSADHPLKIAAEWLAAQPRWARHVDGDVRELRQAAYLSDAQADDANIQPKVLKRAVLTLLQALILESKAR